MVYLYINRTRPKPIYIILVAYSCFLLLRMEEDETIIPIPSLSNGHRTIIDVPPTRSPAGLGRCTKHCTPPTSWCTTNDSDAGGIVARRVGPIGKGARTLDWRVLGRPFKFRAKVRSRRVRFGGDVIQVGACAKGSARRFLHGAFRARYCNTDRSTPVRRKHKRSLKRTR